MMIQMPKQMKSWNLELLKHDLIQKKLKQMDEQHNHQNAVDFDQGNAQEEEIAATQDQEDDEQVAQEGEL